MSDLIERVARAICFANWDGAVSAEAAEAEREYSHDLWVDEARAAIAAVAEWMETELRTDDADPYVSIALRKQLEFYRDV